MNLFGDVNSDFHDTPLSNSVILNNQTLQSVCKGFASPLNYIPQVYLWFRLWQYHWSNKQTIKCTCITLYNYTVHCTIRTRGQSVRRQHRKRNSEKSEMVTHKHVTEVVRNRCVNHQAKRGDSRAIVLIITTFVGALIIWII